MFCEPNLKNRDIIDGIKISVNLPDTYRACWRQRMTGW
jgi:hypothetical protein